MLKMDKDLFMADNKIFSLVSLLFVLGKGNLRKNIHVNTFQFLSCSIENIMLIL